MPVLVNHIAKRNCSAIVHAFQRVFGHATHDLFRQVSRVILRISFQNGFQNDTLRASRNGFCCRHQLHTIAFQLGLVPCAVVAVSGKAVELPDQNDVEQLFVAIFIKAAIILRSSSSGLPTADPPCGHTVPSGRTALPGCPARPRCHPTAPPPDPHRLRCASGGR